MEQTVWPRTRISMERGRLMAELTGRHVFAITAGAFGVIIAVNLVMAWKAVSTFPGLEVANSYAAGVGFDARRAAQVALGWDVKARYDAVGLHLAFADAGGIVRPNNLQVRLGRVTMAADDLTAELSWQGSSFTAPLTLAPGLWRVDVAAQAADGTAFQRRLELRVQP
jgi:nitrogen fixation protein FixH